MFAGRNKEKRLHVVVIDVDRSEAIEETELMNTEVNRDCCGYEGKRVITRTLLPYHTVGIGRHKFILSM